MDILGNRENGADNGKNHPQEQRVAFLRVVIAGKCFPLVAGALHAAPMDNAGVDADFPGGLAGKHPIEHSQYRACHFGTVDLYRSQTGLCAGSNAGIVEADHRNILRHRKAALMECSQR